MAQRQTKKPELEKRKAKEHKTSTEQVATSMVLQLSLPEVRAIIDSQIMEGGCEDEEQPSEVPDDEWIDPPDFEDNLETGEDTSMAHFLPNESEDFWQYAWRNIEEFYGGSIPGPVVKALVAAQTSDGLVVDDDVRNLLSDLQQAYSLTSLPEQTLFPQEADIIFTLKDGRLNYLVNLGPVDQYYGQLSVNQQVVFDGLEISAKNFYGAVETRRENLMILAEYLVEKQSSFLRSPDLSSSMRCLNAGSIKEFAEYIQDKRGTRLNTSQVWRIRTGKRIQVPFQREPLDADIFFDHTPYNIIREIVAAARDKGIDPLAATVFQLIFHVLTETAITERTMRNYLQAAAEVLFSEDKAFLPGKGRKKLTLPSIATEDIAEIAGRVGTNLGLLAGKTITVEDIDRERMRLSVEKKKR